VNEVPRENGRYPEGTAAFPEDADLCACFWWNRCWANAAAIDHQARIASADVRASESSLAKGPIGFNSAPGDEPTAE
jgi:hypothetical protein